MNIILFAYHKTEHLHIIKMILHCFLLSIIQSHALCVCQSCGIMENL